MTAVALSTRALADVERLFEFIAVDDPVLAATVARHLSDALDILARHPHIGRPVRAGLRELVISKGRTGYVALYRYRAAADTVDVLAIRHQREAGFS